MARVIIVEALESHIRKRFKKESIQMFESMRSLEENPKKGKHLAQIGKIAIKEIKYKSHRFYFLVDNYKIKFLDIEDLKDILIKFVRMSHKRDQQKTIEEIKDVLRKLGEGGF
jgi:hypothetical protein